MIVLLVAAWYMHSYKKKWAPFIHFAFFIIDFDTHTGGGPCVLHKFQPICTRYKKCPAFFSDLLDMYASMNFSFFNLYFAEVISE